MENFKSLDPYQASVAEKFAYHDHIIGPQTTQWQKIKCQSLSSSQATLALFPQSRTNLIDRRFYIQMDVTVTDGGNLPVNAAPRAFPVNSIISMANVSINGNSVSSSSSDLIWPFQRFIGYTEEMSFYGASPCQLDTIADLTKNPPTQAYICKSTGAVAATRAVGTDVAGGATFYAVDNPQSPFLINPIVGGYDNQASRGCFPKITNGTASYQYVFTEPLLHPFFTDGDDQSAFTNVNRIDIQLNFVADQYARLMSSVATPLGAGAVTINSVSIMYREMGPSTAIQIPSTLRLNFPQYQWSQQPIATTVNADTTTSDVNISNLVLTTTPSFLYIYARPRQGAVTSAIGNGFLTPKTVRIQAGNKDALLGNLDSVGLWQLSKDNGLKQCSYTQWATTIGGVVCIDCAKDLGMRPGELNQKMLNINATFTNNAYPDINCDMFVLTVLPSTLEITEQEANIISGYSENDKIEADKNEEMLDQSASIPTQGSGFKKSAGMQTHGGFNFGKLLSIGKTALKVGSTAANVASQTGLLPAKFQGAADALNKADGVINKGSGMQRRMPLIGAGRLMG